ncbi:metallophosphoesterase family protein [Haloimpatiens sp. FM7330]|uniref:metallophosphoesterase family protein n=1 Tax=Haloimpatiens sp. FM7330 TaxID=3298610 RepID=UPI00364353AE
MKIAVMSDIHGNLYALENALKDIKKRNVDTIVCLGDLVGYGPFPNEVINLIRTENILNIKGNYDASVVDNKFSYIRDTEINKFSLPWNVENLTEENKLYLKNLPTEITLNYNNKNIKFVHGSPRKINEYLKENSKEAQEVMDIFEGDLLICAHTHIPYIKQYGNKLLLNQGSIGKPKMGRPNSTYAIIELTEDNMHGEIIEISYDYSKTMKDMKDKNFPERIIKSIETGIE